MAAITYQSGAKDVNVRAEELGSEAPAMSGTVGRVSNCGLHLVSTVHPWDGHYFNNSGWVLMS